MMKRKFALALCGLLLAAGCDTFPGSSSFAQKSESVTLAGTIESIVPEKRLFKVRGKDATVVFRAGPQVRNFNEMKVGDKITLDYYESIAVGMADPADPGMAIGEVTTERAPAKSRPGGQATESLSTVVEFISYSDQTHIAAIRLNDGTIEQVLVPREMRNFASTRRPGSKLVIAVDRAVAIQVSPAM